MKRAIDKEREIEKIVNEASLPITKPISIVAFLFLLVFFSSPLVWIWQDWDHAWKVGITGILVVAVCQFLIYCVKVTFRETCTQKFEDIIKSDLEQ